MAEGDGRKHSDEHQSADNVDKGNVEASATFGTSLRPGFEFSCEVTHGGNWCGEPGPVRLA